MEEIVEVKFCKVSAYKNVYCQDIATRVLFIFAKASFRNVWLDPKYVSGCHFRWVRTPWYAHVRGIRNVSFSENFVYVLNQWPFMELLAFVWQGPRWVSGCCFWWPRYSVKRCLNCFTVDSPLVAGIEYEQEFWDIFRKETHDVRSKNGKHKKGILAWN